MIGILLLFLIAVYAIQAKRSSEIKLNETIYDLKREIDRLKYNVDKYEMVPLDGIFEVHITINHHNNYVKLLQFVKRYEKEKGMKIVFAVSSKCNNQYMISYFTRKNDDKLAVQNANHIADELRKSDIEVSRVKVEYHNTKNTPQTDENYQNFEKYLYDKYLNQCGKPYFEFHLKINAHKTKQNYFTDLEEHCTSFNGVAVSYNICGHTKKPLLTIRVYDSGYLNAQHYKDTVVDSLKNIGFTFEDGIQQEFSIFDTNTSLDTGWLLIE